MKKIILATVLAGIGSTAALAADLGARTYSKAPAMGERVYNWAGFYVGATAGAAWTNDRIRLNAEASPYFNNSLGGSDAPAFGALGSPDLKQTNAIFGGKAGYNWQASNWVVGLEGDLSSLRFRRSVTITGNPHAGFTNGTSTFNDSASSDWLATVRGRVGYAYDRALFFGTAGVAFGHSSFQSSIVDLAPAGVGSGVASASTSGTSVGWTAGAGVDYALANGWIVTVEYVHADLGKVNAQGLLRDTSLPVPSTSALTYSAKLESDLVRAGISYKF
jgi:outer membrane immunogenic protein